MKEKDNAGNAAEKPATPEKKVAFYTWTDNGRAVKLKALDLLFRVGIVNEKTGKYEKTKMTAADYEAKKKAIIAECKDEKVPVYAPDKKASEGYKVWVLKAGMKQKDYEKEVKMLDQNHKQYGTMKADITAKYYERKLASEHSKTSSKKAEYFFRWIKDQRWKCDAKTGKPLELAPVKKK